MKTALVHIITSTKAAVLATALLGGGAATSCSAAEETILGFDVSNASISVREIYRGGPPPDGIPSIDNPRFTPTGEVDFLREDDQVIGFSHNDEHRAYPFRVLIWHEIVNDVVGGKPVMATYCPLCGTAMMFSRTYQGQVLTFGVSGLLYNSDVLMFDRQTRSLWSQLGLKAVAGEWVGTDLEWLPSEQMTWAAWRERYPDSQVLNTDTGHRRDYVNLPYGGYFNSPEVMFPVRENRHDLPAKDWVAGVRHAEAEKAYPLAQLPSGEWLSDTIGGAPVTLRYTEASGHFEINDAEGNPIPVVHVFWFAWQAFYPDTQLWAPKSD